MKVQYVADDGKVFDTEIECLNHETLTAFGSDVRFVNMVDTILSAITSQDDRANEVILFEDEEDKIRVATILAKHLRALLEVFELIEYEHSPTKVPKRKNRK